MNRTFEDRQDELDRQLLALGPENPMSPHDQLEELRRIIAEGIALDQEIAEAN